MKFSGILSALAFVAAGLAYAQDQPPVAVPPAIPAATAPEPEVPPRIATIFAQNAIVSTQEGQKAANDLSAKFDPQRREYERRQGELTTLRDQLKRGLATMSAESREKMNQTIDARSTELRRMAEDIQARMDEQEANLMQELGNKLLKIVETYAAEKGLAVVLDVSARPSPVLWAIPTIDITNDIVREYDKAYPVPPAPPPGAMPPVKKD